MSFDKTEIINEYERLLEERADLTARITNLSKSRLAIRHQDTILSLDKNRREIHRQLEQLGRQLSLDPLQVRTDILANECNHPQLGIYGLSAKSVALEPTTQDNEDNVEQHTEQKRKGLLLIFAQKYTRLGWEGQGFELGTSEPFLHRLEERAQDMVRFFEQQNLSDITIETIEDDQSGIAHIAYARDHGIFIPERFVEKALFYLQTRPELWFSETEYYKIKDSYWSYTEINGWPKIELPGSLDPSERIKLHELVQRYQDALLLGRKTHLDTSHISDTDLFVDEDTKNKILLEFKEGDVLGSFSQDDEPIITSMPLTKFIDQYKDMVERMEESLEKRGESLKEQEKEKREDALEKWVEQKEGTRKRK